MKQCTSCKKDVTNDASSIEFPCPKCGKILVRCGNCRKTGVQYTCNKCGFIGP